MRKFPAYFLLSALCLVGCEKEYPTPMGMGDAPETAPTKNTAKVMATAGTTTQIASPLPSGCTAIKLADVTLDERYAYRLKGMTQGDRSGAKTASNLRLFENTKELGPAHSLHADIRTKGAGRFSHSNYNLRFSASDNSNPKSNGRKYIYCMGKSPLVQVQVPAPLPPTPAPVPAPVTSGAIGYANINGTTTGGEGGKTVTVSTLDDLKAAAGSTDKMIIQISGTIRAAAGVRVKSNKTFVGVNGATLDGVGLLMYGVSNIIVKNITFVNAGASDAITIKQNTHHVWIDHCTFGKVKYDGALDITDGSDYVTVSWNHFIGSNKNSLVAGGPDNPNDKGKLHVTYHHNFFDRTVERNPSYGTGMGHVFNNYYLGNSYGVASRYGAIVRVENNYFDDVDQPLINASADAKHGQFSGVETNVFRSSGANKIRTSPSTWVPPYGYSSVMIPAADVPSVVMKGAGAR